MTFDKFRSNIFAILEKSNVNLGRKQAKTRLNFISLVMNQIDDFGQIKILDKKISDYKLGSNNKKKAKGGKGSMDDRVLRVTPKDKTAALDVGKGVQAMTSSQSRAADEQLGRSPYASGGKKDE